MEFLLLIGVVAGWIWYREARMARVALAHARLGCLANHIAGPYRRR